MSPLTPLQIDVLDLARHILQERHGQPAGWPAQVIVTRLGFSEATFFQHLNNMLDLQAAMAHDPVVVNAYRRLRERNLKAGY